MFATAISFSSMTFANSKKNLAVGYTLFKKGSYYQVIDMMKKIKDKSLYSSKYYLLGLSYSKLQVFDEAAKNFKRAVKYRAKNTELYYELGQALFANNDLEMARKSFMRSFKKGYKKVTSLYYMAYISQILEEFKQAKKYYGKLTNNTKADIGLRQIARFQLAEVLTALNQNKSDDRSIVVKYILPQYQKALKLDAESDLAADIKKRIQELRKQYRLDPNLMINGRTLPKKRYTVKFSQKLKYDDNITLATDLPTTTSTQKESFVSDSSLLVKYQMPFVNRYVITPEVRLSSTLYGDRDTKEVFKNDTTFIAPALRTRLEHTVFGKMASLIFDIEHNVTNRDRGEVKNQIFFGRTTSFVFGEKFRLFSLGDTTFKVKRKSYTSYDSSNDYDGTTFQLTQIMSRTNGHLLLLLFINDMTRMKSSSTQDTDSYTLRADYIMPKYFMGYDVHFGFSTNFLDTKEQSSTRGTEKTYTPSVEISRKLSKSIAYALVYDYTKKTSQDSTFSYTKQTFTFELKLNF